jgi:hypothetical protein
MTLDEMYELKDGWNSYKAKAPNAFAIENARNFLKLLPNPHKVNPSAMGGVGITYKKSSLKAYVEFYNNPGKIGLLMYDDLYEDDDHVHTASDTDVNKIKTSIENYFYPLFTEEQIMVASNEELDWMISWYIVDFKDVAYYRRKSCNCDGFEMCKKGETTPDFPDWTANPKYNNDGHLIALPKWSTDGNQMLKLMDWLATHLYLDLIKTVAEFKPNDNMPTMVAKTALLAYLKLRNQINSIPTP